MSDGDAHLCPSRLRKALSSLFYADTLLGLVLGCAAILGSLSLVRGVPIEYLIGGFLLDFIVLLLACYRPFMPNGQPPSSNGDGLIARIEEEIESLQDLLAKCLVVFDLSARHRSRSEKLLEGFVSFYYLMFFIFIGREISQRLVPNQPLSIWLFMIGAFSLLVGVNLGRLYTQYIKTVSILFGRNYLERRVKSMTARLAILESELSSTRVPRDDSALKQKVTFWIDSLNVSQKMLDRTRPVWTVPRELMTAVASVIAAIAPVPTLAVRFSIELLPLIALSGMLVALSTLIIPYGRARSLPRVLHADDAIDKLEGDISKLEESALDSETRTLIDNSLLLSG